MPNSVKIAPSLLSADFSRLGADIEMVEKGGAEVIHYDVMDGHFVPNLTIGPLVLKDIRKCTQLPIDVHLMIENPDQYIPDFAKAGADWISVHVETCPHLHRTIQLIKELGKKAGVVLNPHTPLSAIDEILPDVDFVLIMSVNPGFGGQKLIPSCIDKIIKLKGILKERNLEHIFIEIDGGVKLDNLKKVIDAGTAVVVSGSGIFNTEDPIATIQQMKEV
ncbi:ribulose-phosphate 3-epimerase [Reichenbachiella carrageenanivorans]|uniref:Ribulose-phosphate 3-epimerase n=1 Tax=Reichenbachiella carrageenanivorans TaxID=2979869 RepID=A0ABY6CZ76_9BACT|nr:ribulose-phosphate 3-epimerase [Reichenbachiella carrageenanivorans]UXX79210.1 ribulose-phosphate 3-epimerase [Reichenbachiella carrageenanivorans]